MDNPEKLATKGTQDEEKQNKNTTQYVLETNICKYDKNLSSLFCWNKQLLLNKLHCKLLSDFFLFSILKSIYN